MSEAFFNRLYPSTCNGYPSEWIAALRKAESLSAAIYGDRPASSNSASRTPAGRHDMHDRETWQKTLF